MLDQKSDNDIVLTGYMSILKLCCALAAVMFMIASVAIPKNVSQLRYTAYLFQKDFVVVRISVVFCLSAAVLMNIPNLVRAILRQPSLWIHRDRIRFKGFFDRSAKFSDVSSVQELRNGAVRLKLRSGGTIGIPIILFKDSPKIKDMVRALLVSSDPL